MPPGWYANCELEQALEMQLRELTLLPLNIKYLSVTQFQQQLPD
jgi:hypothetical protein